MSHMDIKGGLKVVPGICQRFNYRVIPVSQYSVPTYARIGSGRGFKNKKLNHLLKFVHKYFHAHRPAILSKQHPS